MLVAVRVLHLLLTVIVVQNLEAVRVMVPCVHSTNYVTMFKK